MSALPRPYLPRGPHRVLVDALHDLHHHAGWPSLRRLAADAGCSHTTVSKAFSSPSLPSLGTLELLVESLGGDSKHFRELWFKATAPPEVDRSVPGIAGRTTELDAVRRHYEIGKGLLLVTGEAGIGKTKLVSAAAELAECFIATGYCLPLSTQVPLMPIADALRSVLGEDEGQWFEEALRTCPAYVAPTLTALLPELKTEPSPPMLAGSDRQRFFAAVVTMLEALERVRPWAMLIEDVPWADPVTLDLLELVLARSSRPAIVATWRTEDPDVPDQHVAWRSRVTRQVAKLHLDELSLAETQEQLRLLGVVNVMEAEAIHRRSRGQPLFTEQLARSGTEDKLPGELQAFLARKMGDLDEGAWVLARTLALANRPLTVSELAWAAGVDDDLTPALRSLDRSCLLADDRDVVRLRHPLVAEAIRLQRVPGEGNDAHRRVAGLLAALPDPPASEIADHWGAAGDRSEELVWRIRAARSAEQRFARGEAYPQWRRVLELWPVIDVPAVEREATLTEAHVGTIETSIGAGCGEGVVRRHVEEAMAASLPDQGRAEVLLRAGDLECAFGDEDKGLRFIDEAVAINEQYPPTVDAGHILEVRALIHATLGRHVDVRADVDRGLAIADAVGALDLRRVMLALKAWTLAEEGLGQEAAAIAAEARLLAPAWDDPACALRVAALEADVLVAAGASREMIVTAAADALAEADKWHISNLFTDSVVGAVALAHLRAGDVTAAAEVVDPRLDGPHTGLATQEAHCAILLRRGHLDEAGARLRELASTGNYNFGSAERDLLQAEVQLWAGHAQEARLLALRAAGFLLTGGYAATSSRALALHARAEADLAEADPQASTRATGRRRVIDLRKSGDTDALGPEAHGPDLRANRLLWHAELARIEASDQVEQWVETAAAWDSLGRPHEAAYCRWRAARVAQSTGRGTVASRLLTSATTDAREHAPLQRAIKSAAECGR